MAITDSVKRAWNAFVNKSPTDPFSMTNGPVVSQGNESPSITRRRYSTERTIISSIYTRIAIDVSGIVFRHVQLDDEHRYVEDMTTNLNSCLTFEPNLDQAPRQFRQDIVQSLFDTGVAAIIPIDTTRNPQTNEVVDIYSLRVGEIKKWYAKSICVSAYNEEKGCRQEITLEKRAVAIVQNPLYSIINEPNSTLQRLIRKLNLLDAVDEQSGSGKLDLIIQLPYTIRSEARRQQAEQRRSDIEFQLKGSKYGIAYTDGTEKITQLNRAVENNLLGQIQYLTNMLYDQLGLTETIMNGTADEATMLNYMNRTIEPILDAITEAMQVAFVGHIGMDKKQSITYFANPFKLVPLTQFADIVDKLSRNEIIAPNEFRGYLGLKPSKDPKADLLINSNMPQPSDPTAVASGDPNSSASAALDDVSKSIDQAFNDLGSA